MAEHVWWGAANVPLTGKQAARADLRGSIRAPEETKINILEVYCLGRDGQSGCRRPYDDVAGQACAAAADNEHLHGGPIAQRKPRTHTHDCIAFGCPGTGVPASTVIAIAAAL